ncbi:MAG: tRNA lysidine(34) synthetase TilS [Anaerolineae bacterium]
MVVGFSGGADSLALLHILAGLQAAGGFQVHAAHLNHALRAEEADADAAFVAATCADWGVPVTIEKRDVAALALSGALGVEEAARQARYAFLGEVAVAAGAAAVAVAHNADDQVETVLMHLLRGSGLAGLRGMVPAVPLSDLRLGEQGPAATGIRLIRPLLDVPRAAIERYLQAHGLTPRFDRSNLDTTYFRNRLRLDLIPCLESYNPNVREVIRRTADVLAAEHDYLREAVEMAWGEVALHVGPDAVVLGLAPFRARHLSLRRSLLRRAIACLRPALRNIDFLHVERAVEALDAAVGAGSRVTLTGGLTLSIGYDRFAVAEDSVADPFPCALPQLPEGYGEQRLSLPADVALAGRWHLTIREISAWGMAAEAGTAGDPWKAHLDADVAAGGLYLRARREGERLQPLGLGGHAKKVNELMINLKIPAACRGRYPVLANAEHLLWLPGHHIDDRARITERTRRVLIASVRER